MSAARGLGLGRRVRYLLTRARAINLGNVTRIAREAAKLARKPVALVVIDMLWSSVRYETGFQDYLDWDFVLLTRRERRTYITHPKSNHLAKKLNDPELRKIFADKTQFNPRFDRWLGREWLDVRSVDADAVRDFVTRHGVVMVKVPDSLSGYGIERVEATAITDWESFRARLLERRQFLVEDFIAQHDEMASLNPSSVNSLRVITYFDGDRTHVLASVLKMGNGGPIDNFSGGGMYTMLDDDGVANSPAFDESGATYATHPLSGTPIVGFRVPYFDRVLAFVDELSREIPEVPYVGWDVAIAPDGPVVIEGNPNSGVYQSKPSVSGIRTGLLPRYRAAIGF